MKQKRDKDYNMSKKRLKRRREKKLTTKGN